MVRLNIKEDVFRWATYDTPFFRNGDFVVGMVAGIIAGQRKKKTKYGKLLFILIATFGFAINIWDTYSAHASFVSKVLNN